MNVLGGGVARERRQPWKPPSSRRDQPHLPDRDWCADQPEGDVGDVREAGGLPQKRVRTDFGGATFGFGSAEGRHQDDSRVGRGVSEQRRDLKTFCEVRPSAEMNPVEVHSDRNNIKLARSSNSGWPYGQPEQNHDERRSFHDVFPILVRVHSSIGLEVDRGVDGFLVAGHGDVLTGRDAAVEGEATVDG
jgi:hypothetical protein